MARKIAVLGTVVLVSIALVIIHAWAEPQMNPGKWEITTTTEMEGMPPQTQTHTQCISADNMIPMSEDANQECQVTDLTTQGNTVSWRISCSGGKMNGTGSVTYNGDSMHGTMSMIIEPYGTRVHNKLSGRRIGPCDGQAATSPSVPSQTAPQETQQQSEVEKSTADTQAPQESSEVQETITEDVKDVGRAAKDEAKENVIDEVRRGIREVIRGLFE
ncbi:MAG: DUF3617 domain-containing protein [Deltaproteobacteria bacterium]|nr:DUF3617 domain-containing protein [Deltaproteobacteria bacterium]